MPKKNYEKEPLDGATDGLLDKNGIAVKLDICPRTVSEWMKNKRLPYVKIGKTVRFVWRDVLEKLNAFRVN